MDSQEAALWQRTAMPQALSDISVNRTAKLQTLCYFGLRMNSQGVWNSPVLWRVTAYCMPSLVINTLLWRVTAIHHVPQALSVISTTELLGCRPSVIWGGSSDRILRLSLIHIRLVINSYTVIFIWFNDCQAHNRCLKFCQMINLLLNVDVLWQVYTWRCFPQTRLAVEVLLIKCWSNDKFIAQTTTRCDRSNKP